MGRARARRAPRRHRPGVRHPGPGRDGHRSGRHAHRSSSAPTGCARRSPTAVGAPTEHETTGGSAFIYGYFAGLGSDRYDWFFRPGASAGVIPTNDGLANVFVGLPAARFAAERHQGAKEMFATVLAQAAPEVAACVARTAMPVSGFRSFPGHPGFLRRAHGPGWALVGRRRLVQGPGDGARHHRRPARRRAARPGAARFPRRTHRTPRATRRSVTSWPARSSTPPPVPRPTSGRSTSSASIHLDLKRVTDPEIELVAGLSDPFALAV